jgi:hypothetical protein
MSRVAFKLSSPLILLSSGPPTNQKFPSPVGTSRAGHSSRFSIPEFRAVGRQTGSDPDGTKRISNDMSPCGNPSQKAGRRLTDSKSALGGAPPERCCDRVTFEVSQGKLTTAGTAKIPGSRTRHHLLGVGLWVGFTYVSQISIGPACRLVCALLWIRQAFRRDLTPLPNRSLHVAYRQWR